ncbi:unnamed protein product [Prorocentrum cordatum]|nr:unnamed protein product [Polarella glacialis]
MSGMAAARAAGSIVVNGLELFGGIGQALEFKMSQAHHEMDCRYSRINLHQDMQSLRLDALDHGKEEIRENYDMYVGRIESLLLVLALIWPFALSTIQFSDPFIPVVDSGDCPDGDCPIEEDFKILVHIWVCLIALVLVLPFWGILCLIRVKLTLDAWLEESLAGLKEDRKAIVKAMKDPIPDTVPQKADEVVQRLVDRVSKCQDKLSDIWSRECSRPVHLANILLWISAYMALCLSAISVWIFLWNKGGTYRIASIILGTAVFVIGCFAPLAYYLVYLKGPEADGDGDPDGQPSSPSPQDRRSRFSCCAPASDLFREPRTVGAPPPRRSASRLDGSVAVNGRPPPFDPWRGPATRAERHPAAESRAAAAGRWDGAVGRRLLEGSPDAPPSLGGVFPGAPEPPRRGSARR